MSHALSLVSKKDSAKIVEAEPLNVSKNLKLLLIVLAAVGVLAFLRELFAGDAKYAWNSLHVNFTYWFLLAAACSCFGAVFHICNAEWSRPIRRFFESGINFFSISALFLILLYFGRGELFVWSHEHIHGKGYWLEPWFVYPRDILAIILLVAVARKLIGLSLKRDLIAIRGGLTGASSDAVERWNDKKYDCCLKNVSPDAKAEIAETTAKMGFLSPIVVIVYALSISLFAFDQLMSVDPHWFSTMFGAFIFMTGVYLCMAWVSIKIWFFRKIHPLYLTKIDRKTLHDIGKLLFGFGIFWTYLFWSQYLPIWYGNMPEETGYLILRLREEPWHGWAWAVLACCFIIPFFLGLSRDLKQHPPFLAITATIVFIGVWMLIYLLFIPSNYGHHIPFGLTDVLIALGFFGAYFYSVVMFLEKYPLIPFGDMTIK